MLFQLTNLCMYLRKSIIRKSARYYNIGKANMILEKSFEKGPFAERSYPKNILKGQNSDVRNKFW
jgi:hypothetical protein